jgi:cysteinyl-tRNA synthetase
MIGSVSASGPRRPAAATTKEDRVISNFAVQLQNYPEGRLDALARGGYRLAVIDLARDAHDDYFTADEIRRLRSSGTRVLAYFEIGSIEEFRPDYPSFTAEHADLVLNEWPSWPGEHFVRYWDPRWWEHAVRPRVDRAIAAGFDGIFLDTPLAYEEIDLALVPGATRDELGRRMVDLIRHISEFAKSERPGFLVFPLNSPELRMHAGYTESIDGVAIESLFFRPTDDPCNEPYCATNLREVRELRRAGKTVLAIDYAKQPENVAEACRRYREEDFAGYVTVKELDVLSPPCT